MIISNIIGGLGNQMFQYALGRALSQAFAVPLRLDTRDFAGYPLHNGYELDRVFGLQAPLAKDSDLHAVLGLRGFAPLRRLLTRGKLAALRGGRFVVEPQPTYWPGILRIPRDCYLLGTWQTEKYFNNIDEIIRADFAFPTPLSNANTALAERIGSCNSVSLHVRRGDIARNAATLAHHGLCSLDFYRQAMDYVASRVARPEFFVFSDDVNWVRDNLGAQGNYCMVEHNTGSESYNDMRLMSLCRHHIVANSTFSWWGAWLNRRTDKIVVSPRRWFAVDLNCSDIAPDSWVRVG